MSLKSRMPRLGNESSLFEDEDELLQLSNDESDDPDDVNNFNGERLSDEENSSDELSF